MISMQRLMYALVLFPLTVSTGIAQEVSVKFGDVIDVPNAISTYAGCFAIGNGSYLLNFSEGGFGQNEAKALVNVYDQDFKLKESKTYQSNIERSETVALSYSKGKLAWFITQRPKGEDNLTCYISTGPVSGDMGKKERLFEIPTKGLMPTSVSYMASPDSSKHVIHAIYDREDKETKPLVNLVVMDDAFNEQWDKRIVLGYTERRLKALSWAASPNGDVFMLAKIYGNDKFDEAIKRDGERVPDYKLVIFQFSKEEDKPKEYELKLGDLFVNGPAIFTNKQNELTCAGFFAKSHTGNSVGVFNLKLNVVDGNILTMKKHDFDKEDLKQFGKIYSMQDKDGHWGISSNFNFRQVQFGEDGRAALMAEDASDSIDKQSRITYEKPSTVNPSGAVSSSTSRRYFYKNGVAIFQFNATGDFESVRLIRKLQSLTTEFFGGFSSLSNEKGIFVFYNDHEDNLEKGLDDKFKTMGGFNKNTMPVVAIQSLGGEIKRKPLYDIKAVESLILPTQNNQLNDHQLLFVSMKPEGLINWNYRLGLIAVKE
ncbi:MAG: hypothetical protein GC192_20745 [Bacteroidetes bacterium]|nr:hypothetical protein [Bacteroidota bacterium]